MIVKMKKTAVLCLLEDKEATLGKLRELGVLHVECDDPRESSDRAELEKRKTEVDHALEVLSGLESEGEGSGQIGKASKMKAAEAVDRINRLSSENNDLEKHLRHLRDEREQLLPWGDFSFNAIDKLRKNGLYVYLCSANEIPKIPENSTFEIISRTKSRVFFALLSENEIDESEIPVVHPPRIPLRRIEKEIAETRDKISENHAKIAELTPEHEKVGQYALETNEKLEFLNNRDAMTDTEHITYIRGYVPVPDVKNLEKAALENGWALHLTAPEEDDKPPTLIKVPKVFEIAKPIFSFMGIAPGYDEWDISVCFLFFFTLFFGMIVGDAGYGLVFLALSLYAKFTLKGEKTRRPVNLFIVLSITTLAWGILSGNYFGVTPGFLPEIFHGIKALTDPAVKDANVQLLCFLIAAVHLSLARAWKAIIYINSKKALGELGWMILIWGNFFTAVSLIVTGETIPEFVLYGYGVGIFLILLFHVNWKDIGEILNTPFGLIGSFVDLLSYIRLFALGLSTYYIAKSFNSMGMMILDVQLPKIFFPLLVIAMILVLLFGHVLNILMAMIAVLVHAIRLNTLEFSNHMGLQWAGIIYRPFKKTKTKSKEES